MELFKLHRKTFVDLYKSICHGSWRCGGRRRVREEKMLSAFRFLVFFLSFSCCLCFFCSLFPLTVGRKRKYACNTVGHGGVFKKPGGWEERRVTVERGVWSKTKLGGQEERRVVEKKDEWRVTYGRVGWLKGELDDREEVWVAQRSRRWSLVQVVIISKLTHSAVLLHSIHS